ncbi:MAG: TIM barrel protein [Oscillospiraceae bacterium]
MIIGVQTYTIRDFIRGENQIQTAFQKLRTIGYRTIQACSFEEIRPERLRELADENGIQMISSAISHIKLREETDQVIKECQILGCKHVSIGSFPHEYVAGGWNGVQAFFRDFTLVAEKLATVGMKFHCHNHYYEFERFDGKSLMEWMLQETDPKLWGMVLDVYWVQYAGKNPATMIRKLKGRIDICHIKDMAVRNRELQTVPVMEGNLDWQDILSACEETGVPYAMVEQDDTYGKDPFDELKISYDHLKNSGMQF